MEWTKKRIIGAGVGGLFAIGLIGSVGEESGSSGGGGNGGGSASSQSAGRSSNGGAGASSNGDSGNGAGGANEAVSDPAATPSEAPRPTLTLTMPTDRDVYRDRVTVAGRVTVSEGGNVKGVSVLVDGKPAPVKDGRWSKTVTVDSGDTDVEVTAEKGAYEADSGEVTFTRKRSKAEIAAAAEKRRVAAAAAKSRYMALAQTIPYNQLEKNPDRQAGKRVKYTGQIFQIQEDFGSTVILLSVTDEGYGFWTDNIWVDYDGTIKGAEDDIITVYGTIEGEKSYDTQIGGETYVPQMTAKYVVE